MPIFIAVAIANRLAVPNEGLYQAFALLILMSATLTVQLAALERHLLMVVGGGIATVFLASALTFPAFAWGLMLLASATIAAALIAPDRARQSRGTRTAPAAPRPTIRSLRPSGWLAIPLRVQCKALAAHPGVTALR